MDTKVRSLHRGSEHKGGGAEGALEKTAPPPEISGPHGIGCKDAPPEMAKCHHNGTYNGLNVGSDVAGDCKM
jgi:hypothetical protein